MIDLPTVLHTPPRWWTPRFDVPEGITVIDLAEDPLAAAGRLSAQARSVLPGIPDDQVSHLVESQRAVVDALRAGGVYWAGSCVARSGADPGCLTVAHLAASLLETGTVDTDLAAAVAELNGSAGAASRQYPGAGDSDRVADVIQLPAGPAMLVISEQVIHPVRTTIGTPDGTARRIRQVLVALPVPGAARLAVLTLATEHLADWTAYLDLMARIARSLGFSSD